MGFMTGGQGRQTPWPPHPLCPSCFLYSWVHFINDGSSIGDVGVEWTTNVGPLIHVHVYPTFGRKHTLYPMDRNSRNCVSCHHTKIEPEW